MEGKEKGQTDREYRLSLSAGWTGLEPATSAVTGQHSNQLNYQPMLALFLKDGKDKRILFLKTNFHVFIFMFLFAG